MSSVWDLFWKSDRDVFSGDFSTSVLCISSHWDIRDLMCDFNLTVFLLWNVSRRYNHPSNELAAFQRFRNLVPLEKLQPDHIQVSKNLVLFPKFHPAVGGKPETEVVCSAGRWNGVSSVVLFIKRRQASSQVSIQVHKVTRELRLHTNNG